MSTLVDMPKPKLVQALQTARNSMRGIKEKGKVITSRVVNVGAQAGTGYLVGMARKKYGTGAAKKIFVPGTEVEGDLAGGVLLSVAGIAGLGDNFSDVLCSIGGAAVASNLAISAFTSVD